MKAKLIFDMDNPEDCIAHLRAVHADQMWIALSEIAFWSKHDIPPTGAEMLHKIREVIYDRIPNLEELGQ